MGRVRKDGLFKKVLCLLEKLSSGWRQPREEKHYVVHGGSSSLFVEHYMVDKQFCLVWAVDFIRESSYYTQILKVWDILRLSDIPKRSNQLDIFYGTYTVDKMSRCMHIFRDGYAFFQFTLFPLYVETAFQEDFASLLKISFEANKK